MSRLHSLRDRWADPLLTALTILLALIIFLIAPLQAAGVAEAEDLGFAIITLIIGALVILSGNAAAIFVMVVGFSLTAAAAVLRLQQPSTLDLYLKATGWILMSLALIWVVTRAVFASGKSHHGSHFALSRHRLDFRRSFPPDRVVVSACIRRNGNQRLPGTHQPDGLFQLWHSDDGRLW
jgi:hypothetical protein